MSSDNARLKELGDFLRARRAELTPQAVGLPSAPSARRVPGLRREEVARLAAISTDYYRRLEQGRIRASGPVLDELARALRLTDDQRTYLFELAGKPSGRPRVRSARAISPQLRRLLDQLPEGPALVLGSGMDILAWNGLAAALITDFARIPEHQRNYVRMVFTDPAMRVLYPDWEDVARKAVTNLHMDAARHPDDPRLAGLVRELSTRDADFRTWWHGQHVESKGQGTKRFHHPVVGDLTLDWDTLICDTAPDQFVIVLTAEPGTPSHDALRILASWAAVHLPTTSPSANSDGEGPLAAPRPL
ncbi:helix-turn-helix domain-containing protein [Kutzneria buriramensis]|uniref:Helix-turn-helix protein n=1 Tax=Kutzneria buriramensis TaxID=1045776 RepID=A0A3E0G5A1_9PSEU|nr:helix-turn-helix transcriptional regulator [Kutzneria buriramensis]REH17978.1 helix-turn-helix protein [Kutzneria buriramensis]